MENGLIYQLCDAVLDELKKFDGELRHLGGYIDDDRLRLFEKNIGFNLPLDFNYLLSLQNGFSLMGVEVYGLDQSLQGSSLDKVYHFEHYDAGNPMPAHFLPFSPDGFGSHYCLDLSNVKGGICPIVFWQHDVIYRSPDAVENCNKSFTEWVQEVMIDWTLEDYNYDGTEK